ncbi:MAG: M1 family metallopeptidase [Saprospiraceae bacterium]|nr:M1 family metallopeptidase [Saprospiraceae bacterium]
MRLLVTILMVALFLPAISFAQNTSNHGNKFEPLGSMLPPGNQIRGNDGAPGPDYWQQRCDYTIACTLDAEKLNLSGKETLTYYNQSPSTLHYIWLQLDENQHNPENDNQVFDPSSINDLMSENDLRLLDPTGEKKAYGVNIEAVTNASGQAMDYFINNTMMRVNLDQPLKPGEKIMFNIAWNYNIINRQKFAALSQNFANYPRGGYEYFEDNGNYLFTITQWFPRVCVYSDFEGWQNKQFTGRGEFALNFGNYDVKMTLPDDYMVGATGQCQNYKEVLSPNQYQRWQKAQSSDTPVEMVTLEEAKANEVSKPSTNMKTWHYKAENVRDFAWTASRKFVWDALRFKQAKGEDVMCMSYYGKEAYPIYNRYSTKAVEHTLKVYSKYSIPYPYPVAISVEADNGMEYPMICFNPGRAEPDGTYEEEAKHAAISVIIHEVGHNYFPMVINSDERQWSWFDEGLNTFVQYLAESEWDINYKSWAGPAYMITDYMSLPKEQLEPIMTSSDNIIGFFPNAYLKPATALNILRETVMGRELFDRAFREYCERWAFKHPTPADFFRTMGEASGEDLNWFWRGWFYSIDAVDISLDTVKWYKVDLKNDPEPKTYTQTQENKAPIMDVTRTQNLEQGVEFAVDADTSLLDFYNKNPTWESADSITTHQTTLYANTYSKKEKKKQFGDKNYYELTFTNKGGLVMPIILEWTFEDGTKEIETIPVEIWRKNENSFTKVFVKDKEVKAIVLDPRKETADIDTSNNNWPVKELPSKFQVFKSHQPVKQPNRMQMEAGKTIKP